MKCKYLILTCIILICISSISVVYAKYILKRDFNISVITKPFYFDAVVQQNNVELNGESNIELTIKNYLTDNEYNDFDTNYQITLENNNKFAITVEDPNSGIITSGKKDNNVTLKLTVVNNASIKARDSVVIKITSTKPYNKEIRIKLNVYMIGKYIRYDNKLWVIMYNNDEYGLQAISDNVLEVNNVCLGYVDTAIENAVNETMQNKDLNGDGVIENITLDGNRASVNNLERAAYSYNNIIKTLNKRSESLVTDKSKIQKNAQGEYLIRSVGTDAIDKDKESTTFHSSSRLEIWPIDSSNSIYEPGALNKKLKSADTNYRSDLDTTRELNLIIGYDSSGAIGEYWFGTRYIIDEEETSEISFGGRYVTTSGSLTRRRFFKINSTGASVASADTCYGIRPVITFDSNVELSGLGTKTSPFVVQ